MNKISGNFTFQSLGLFINMAEHCDSNRQMIVDTCVYNSYEAEFKQHDMPALEALVQVREHPIIYTYFKNPNNDQISLGCGK